MTKRKEEVYNWQFKGIVKNLSTPGRDALYITVNGKEYALREYRTWINIDKDKRYDSVSKYSVNTMINNGDSLIKNAWQWDLTLIQASTKKKFIFNCQLDSAINK